MMTINDYLKEIDRCVDCKTCKLACPIYTYTKKEIDTPYNRLQIAKKIFNREKITIDEFKSIYNCPKCEKCEVICSSEIKISKIVGKAREELFIQGYELLPGHQALRNGILQRKNSVKGDPTLLLDYLPKNFEINENASILYYAGCLPGYFLKDIASSSVQLLKKVGIYFKVIKDEICYGSPLMDLGDVESARKFFKENIKIFKRNRVKELIVSCSGCYRCFKEFYPELLGMGKTIKIRHIVDVIAQALKEGKIKFKKLNSKVIYHDPCHLSREFAKYDSPREILKATIEEMVELLKNR